MTDVIIFHTDEQGNKTACILSNNKTVLDDLIKFVKDDNFKIMRKPFKHLLNKIININ